jgi:hypothetical protein
MMARGDAVAGVHLAKLPLIPLFFNPQALAGTFVGLSLSCYGWASLILLNGE